MKVERFSYPVITPSAGRGIFDAVYWEGVREDGFMRPYFHWQIRRIEALSEPRYLALRRNEVKEKAPSDRTILRWMRGQQAPEPIWADANKEETGTDQKGRTQRQTMALSGIRYRLFADIVPHGRFKDGKPKFDAIFERRAKAGQCFQQPYFGCREFPAFFEWRQTAGPHEPKPACFDADLGWMLYDVFDLARDQVSIADCKPFITLFKAKLSGGVLEVPDFSSDAVKKPPRS